MTITRDFASESGMDDAARGSFDPRTPSPDEKGMLLAMRVERLTGQIVQFERAGYRLESRSDVQAVVARPRRRLLSALLGVSAVHRVVITIDGAGGVRLA